MDTPDSPPAAPPAPATPTTHPARRPRGRRANGEGTIFWHEKKQAFVGVISLGVDGAGKRHRRWVTGESKSDVKTKLDEIKAQAAAGVTDPGRESVAAYVNRWLEDTVRTTTRHNTYTKYRWILEKHVLPFLGHHCLGKLLPDHVQALLKHMEVSGASVRLRQMAFSVLRTCMNLAVERRAIMHSPMRGVKPPQAETQKKAVYLDPVKTQLLLTRIDGWLKRFVYMAVGSGARLGELLALRWSDLDPADGSVTISKTMLEIRVPVTPGEDTQGDKWKIVHKEAPVKSKVIPVRRVALPDQVMALFVDEWRARAANDAKRAQGWPMPAGEHPGLDALIFANRAGGPRIQNNVRRAFLEALHEAGLPRMKIHELRHTSATLLLAAGENPKVVQERLGHSKVGITLDIYSHVPREVDRRAADKLGGLLTAANTEGKS